MSEREIDARRDHIEEVVAAMATDLGHVSWMLVGSHLRNLGHLPLSTLDSWRGIARSPKACLAAVIKFPEKAAELANRLRDELGVVWELTSSLDVYHGAVQLRDYWGALVGSSEAKEMAQRAADAQLEQLSVALPPLSLAIDLARFKMGLPGLPQQVVQLQHELSSSRNRMLDALWRCGDSSMGQQLLLRVHADDAMWPDLDLTQRAVAALAGILDPQVSQALQANAGALFWLPREQQANGRPIIEPRRDAANIPSVCAVWAISGAAADWWREPANAFAVRQVRAFDPLWFEEAYRHALKVCVAIGLGGPILSPGTAAHPISRPNGSAGNGSRVHVIRTIDAGKRR